MTYDRHYGTNNYMLLYSRSLLYVVRKEREVDDILRLPTNLEQPTSNVIIRTSTIRFSRLVDRFDRYVPVFQKSRKVIALIDRRSIVNTCNLFVPHAERVWKGRLGVHVLFIDSYW